VNFTRKSHIFLLSFLFVIGILDLSSQRRLRYRYEYFGSVGTSSFLGDVGGADQEGTNLLADLNPSATRFAISGGIRYKRHPQFGAKAVLTFGWLAGSDSKTEEQFRNNRNLSFSTPIIELAVQGEYYFNKEKRASIYRVSKLNGKKVRNTLIYAFGGAGLFWYHPMAKVNGSFYNLRKIGTEGQNLAGGPKKYLGVSASLMLGLGVKIPLSRQLAVGVEFAPRYTFTDFIDDVSGVYANNDAIKAQSGEIGAFLADPNLGVFPDQWDPELSTAKRTREGYQRGDPKNKDTYAFFQFNMTYKFIKRRRTRSKF
jgi:hypothetical protein